MFEWPERNIQNRWGKTGRKTEKGGIVFFDTPVSLIKKIPGGHGPGVPSNQQGV